MGVLTLSVDTDRFRRAWVSGEIGHRRAARLCGLLNLHETSTQPVARLGRRSIRATGLATEGLSSMAALTGVVEERAERRTQLLAVRSTYELGVHGEGEGVSRCPSWDWT